MVPAPKASFVLVNVGTEGDVDEIQVSSVAVVDEQHRSSDYLRRICRTREKETDFTRGSVF